MPLWIVFVNMWRMVLRPVLGLLRDVAWAWSHSLSLFHYKSQSSAAINIDVARNLIPPTPPNSYQTV